MAVICRSEISPSAAKVSLLTQRLNLFPVTDERSQVQPWRQRPRAALDFWSQSQVCDLVALFVAGTVR